MEKNLYFLGLQPPFALAATITQLKEDISRRYGCTHALNVPPHLTLVPPFRVGTGMQGLGGKMPAFAASVSPFPVYLRGFGYFENAHNRVIFVAVDATSPLQDICRGLSGLVCETLTGMPRRKEEDFHPHITLAHRDLTSDAFYEAWPHYQNTVFEATFTAQEITLFVHQDRHWEVASRYPFGEGDP